MVKMIFPKLETHVLRMYARLYTHCINNTKPTATWSKREGSINYQIYVHRLYQPESIKSICICYSNKNLSNLIFFLSLLVWEYRMTGWHFRPQHFKVGLLGRALRHRANRRWHLHGAWLRGHCSQSWVERPLSCYTGQSRIGQLDQQG